MTQLVLAWTFVVVPEEEVVIETGQTIPAEDVLAALAHHLRAALVLLDRDGAHRAALDEIIVERDAECVRLSVHRQPAGIFLARHRRVPRLLTTGTEILPTGGTMHGTG